MPQSYACEPPPPSPPSREGFGEGEEFQFIDEALHPKTDLSFLVWDLDSILEPIIFDQLNKIICT